MNGKSHYKDVNAAKGWQISFLRAYKIGTTNYNREKKKESRQSRRLIVKN